MTRADEVRTYRAAGHTNRETAARFGIHERTVRKYLAEGRPAPDPAPIAAGPIPAPVVEVRRSLPLPPRPPAVIRRHLPEREPWHRHVPVWVWQWLAAVGLVWWAFHR